MQALTRAVLAKLKTSRTVATCVGSSFFLSAALALSCDKDAPESEASPPAPPPPFRVRSSSSCCVPEDTDFCGGGRPPAPSSLATTSFGGMALSRGILLAYNVLLCWSFRSAPGSSKRSLFTRSVLLAWC